MQTIIFAPLNSLRKLISESCLFQDKWSSIWLSKWSLVLTKEIESGIEIIFCNFGLLRLLKKTPAIYKKEKGEKRINVTCYGGFPLGFG